MPHSTSSWFHAVLVAVWVHALHPPLASQNYEYAISNFSVNLAALRTDIDAIDGPLVQLKDPNTGAGSIANDLIEADKDSNYPTSTISDVTAGPNSLDELLSGTSTMVREGAQRGVSCPPQSTLC